MNDREDIRLDLLLFSVHGVHFGVDTEQVAGVEVYEGEQANDLFWLHEELAYGEASAPYVSPVVLTVKSDVQSCRIIIDLMEDIAEFSQNDICLLPSHLETLAIKSGLWGVIPRNGVMILLLDFRLLLKRKQPEIN